MDNPRLVQNTAVNPGDVVKRQATEMAVAKPIDLNEFDRWRATERRRITVHRVRILLGLTALSLLGSLGWWLYDRRLGHLPDSDTLQRELKIWALPEKMGVIRGRPARQIEFTRDASTNLHRPFSLYFNDARTPIALAGTTVTYALEGVKPLFSERSDLLIRNQDAVLDRDALHAFLERYVGPLDLSAPKTLVDEHEDDGHWVQEFSVIDRVRGFTIERTSHVHYWKKGDPAAFAIQQLIIVKAREW